MLEKQLPHAPPYQLRTNRAPRSGYGTCGSRTYSFVKQIASEAPDKRLTRELDVSPHEQFDARTRACPQQEILAIQASKQQIHHVVITITRRERPKSAPYLRLKNIQGTTIGKIWKKNFFQKKIDFFSKKVFF